MNEQELVALVGERPSVDRERALLSLVFGGKTLPIVWHSIASKVGELQCTFMVASDALCVGTKDGFVRINVCHDSAQKIADFTGLALPTTKVSDLIHQQATVLALPRTQTPDSRMADTSRMVKHSQAVSAALGSLEGNGLASSVGKDWVLTNRLVGRPEKAANYGWHIPKSAMKGPGGMPVLQPLGLAHDRMHVDYSQVVRLIHRWVYLTDKTGHTLMRTYEDILQDPELHVLLSDEGPLQIIRHPGVPVASIPPPAPPVC